MKSKLKIVSGHQPAYLPWLGIFHKLYLSDIFVYMDTVQFLNNDWINRNNIKTGQQKLMLTVPIDKKNSEGKNINNMKLFAFNDKSRNFWQRKHWESIKINYSKAPYFKYFQKDLELIYLKEKWLYLVDLCWHQFNFFRKILGLGHKDIVRMSEFKFTGTKSDLILDHCRKLNCNAVVLGEMGKNYINLEKFNKEKILIYFQKYKYTVYNQQYMKNGFINNLSVLDLILNEGPENSYKILIENNLKKDQINSSTWINYNQKC